jgi:hypothetical protein
VITIESLKADLKASGSRYMSRKIYPATVSAWLSDDGFIKWQINGRPCSEGMVTIVLEDFYFGARIRP